MKTTQHFYKFDTNKPEESKAYNELCEKLRSSNHDFFNGIEWPFKERSHLGHGVNREIELETQYLFDNQWNTSKERLFDWCELILTNRNIKKGYWLEITPEIRELRDNTRCCGYCGKLHGPLHQHDQHKAGFCLSCLGSQYLKENELHLLRLVPLTINGRRTETQGHKRAPLTDKEKAWLLPLYVEKQTKDRASEDVQRRERQIEEVKRKFTKTTENARIEKEGKLWFLERCLSIDNLIYYSHTSTWCIGWRNPVTEVMRAEWQEKTKGFPFKLEFKTV